MRAAPANPPIYNIEKIRGDFPALQELMRGKPLAYLDNAATTQKPQAVLDVIQNYYVSSNANIHRAVHLLAQRATEAYESAREKTRQFLNAERASECVFVRGTTEAVNLAANAYARPRLKPGDEIVVSAMEHHSNIVPWQLVCQATGARLRVIPMNNRGELIMEEYEALLNEKTQIVSVVHVSNALGTVNPVREIGRMAHEHGAVFMVDGAQAVQHMRVDVQELNADFYAFSGHKLYGPTGIGILYGKHEHLESMEPYEGGGEMILSVSFEKTTYNDPPHKFEAGTPNIAGAAALEAALDYVMSLGVERIAAHEKRLLEYAHETLSFNRRVQLVGTAAEKASVISFVMDSAHPHDIGTILDSDGVAIRTGHHCAQPAMERLGVPATARASIGLYNTTEDIDALARSLNKVAEIFG
ncbi:MAG: cysteine desulfurase [Candidatus Poribacteria bacterium]|nr:cysteine desulfurase [Candidatus Poribacteria bacterium]